MPSYLKRRAEASASGGQQGGGSVNETVRAMLDSIEAGREAAALKYAAQLDGYKARSAAGSELEEKAFLVLNPLQMKEASALLDDQLRADMEFAHDNVKRFAERQRESLTEVELEVVPGLVAGQKLIPVTSAGCYVPGGRYAHIASAIMTVTTAKVAGVSHITACSPPSPAAREETGEVAFGGVPPAIVYAAYLCGADQFLCMGGVQAIASMAFGLFGLPKADILVGPGNQYVAEAKRMLFGGVGIDTVAGPTDSLILADSSADAEIVAVDLVSQAEHGYNSPVWLVTDDRALAEGVIARVPALLADLPGQNGENATAAWRDHAEVVLCADPAEMATVSDEYAPEHLTVMAADLDWWLSRLRNYGSLFLGEETTVSFGDKAAGPNHVLPTSGAARYTGGLSVHKFMKVVTYQRATRDGMKPVALATARISRAEGMEGHARAADIRLSKFFPNETFDLGKQPS